MAPRWWCWKGLKDGEACQGSETVDLEIARGRRSWPELRDGEADRRSARRRNWPAGVGDNRGGKCSKMPELVRARRRRGCPGAWIRRSWPVAGDDGADQGSETTELATGQSSRRWWSWSELKSKKAELARGSRDMDACTI